MQPDDVAVTRRLSMFKAVFGSMLAAIGSVLCFTGTRRLNQLARVAYNTDEPAADETPAGEQEELIPDGVA